MKRDLRAALVLPFVLLAFAALAGPRPRATLTVSPTSVVLHDFSDVQAVATQCPQGAVWYRTFSAAEVAAQDGGLQADGGGFGVLADFRNNGDPIVVVRSDTQVAVGFAGISDAGSATCFLSTP